LPILLPMRPSALRGGFGAVRRILPAMLISPAWRSPTCADRFGDAADLGHGPDLLAGGGLLDLELRHRSGHDEIAVIEAERARNSVLIELKADGIGWGLFPGLGSALVEIADGDGPAFETRQHRIAGCRIVRQLVARGMRV